MTDYSAFSGQPSAIYNNKFYWSILYERAVARLACLCELRHVGSAPLLIKFMELPVILK